MQFDRDLSTVTPQAAQELLETGWYPANITAQQEKPNSKGTGNLLEFKYKLHNGRTMTSRHNVKHTNPQTVDIAYQELSAIAHAVGHPKAKVAQELVGGPLEIYIKKEERSDKPGVMGNDVAGFRAIGATGSQPGFSGAAGTQVAAAPAWAAPAQPANAYNAPAAPVNAPQWMPPSAPVVVAPAPQWQPPQPVPQPPVAAPAAPAGAGSVPPWAR